MVDFFNIESCELIGHSCDCSDLNKDKCEKNRKRRDLFNKTDSKPFNCSDSQSSIDVNDNVQNCTDVLVPTVNTAAAVIIESTEIIAVETLSPTLSEEVGEYEKEIFNTTIESTVETTTSTTSLKVVETTIAVPSERTVTVTSKILEEIVEMVTAGSRPENVEVERKSFDEKYIAPTEQKKQIDALELVVLIPPAEFVPQIEDFLDNITVLLRVETVLITDEEGPMIYKWKDGTTGERVNIEKASLLQHRGSRSSGEEGVILTLELNFKKYIDCNFTDVKQVANFVQTAVDNKDPVIEALKINKARVIPSKPNEDPTKWYLIFGVFFVFCFALIILAIVRGKKIIQSPEWTIPVYDEIDVESNRSKTTTQTLSRLILPTVQPKPVYPQLSNLHLLALSNQSIHLPINHHYLNLKAGPIGNTPLHCVVVNSSKNQQQICYDIENLLRAGADLNARNDLGETALYLACRYQKTQIIVQLLSLGADPSIRSNENSTPLHQVASNNDLMTIEEMLKYESVRKTINEIDARDRTPLEVSTNDVFSFQVAERLINSGAHMDHTGEQCDVAVCNRKTALHWAVEASNIQMIKFLVERGSNIDSQDRDGQTPLFLASELNKIDVVKILIEMGANHEILDQREMTPLDIARLRVWTDIAEFLAALPRREPPPVIEVTPRIPAVRTKKERKRKNSTNITASNELQATPQFPVKKAKRTAKHQLPLTPPTSDESAANTPVTYRGNSGLLTSSQESNRAPANVEINDGYNPQGMNSGYLPRYFQESPGSNAASSSASSAVSHLEDETAANYVDYLNFEDNESNYMNL